MRFVHISDLHFGPHYRPAVGESLLDYLAQGAFDAVVITGDFTQRATREQFVQAGSFLERLRSLVPEVVVCPGNHDIPLFRIWERVFYPFRLYKKFIHPHLNQIVDIHDARIIALNSVRPLKRLVEGRLSRQQLRLVQSSLSQNPQKMFRILALHHPPDVSHDRPVISSREREFVRLCIEQKVDIVLSGHVHVSRVLPLTSSPGGAPLLVGCGTTTSGRGRQAEKDRNTFRLIEGDAQGLTISTFALEPGTKIFVILAREDYPKPF